MRSAAAIAAGALVAVVLAAFFAFFMAARFQGRALVRRGVVVRPTSACPAAATAGERVARRLAGWRDAVARRLLPRGLGALGGGGGESGDDAPACAVGGEAVLLLGGDGGRAVRLRRVDTGDFAAYNPSATPDGRVTTLRVCDFNYCPGTTALSVVAGGFRSEAVVVTGGAAYQVERPAWAGELWDDAPARQSGPEDARPVLLPGGRLVLLASFTTRADSRFGGLPVLAAVVLPPMRVGDDPGQLALVAPPSRIDESHDSVQGGLAAVVTGEEAEPVDAAPLVPDAIVVLGPRGGRPTKNWMPAVTGDTLRLVTHLAPQTTVAVPAAALLSARGLVEVDCAPELAAWAGALAVTAQGETAGGAPWRGSTPLAPWSGALLAAVHRRRGGEAPAVVRHFDGPAYDHALAVFDAAPPHAVRALSRPFRLVPRLDPTAFAYVAGLVARPGGDVELAFGVNDCTAAAARLPARLVARLLADGPRAPPEDIPVA